MAIIIDKNNLLPPKTKRYSYKINIEIETFIIELIKDNNTLTAKNISESVFIKFKTSISSTSVYNILKKNNITYKKTSININPHSFEDQKDQLENVYYHLTNNVRMNNTFYEEYKKNINKMNELLNRDIEMIKINDINKFDNDTIINLSNSMNEFNKINNVCTELVSVDEFSIITNRTSTYGWSLKGEECVIKLPYLKPNKRYSLLMATTNKKIINYVLVEGSIKTDTFITFIGNLNKLNSNYSFLIDNASIHSNKKTKQFYKKHVINDV